MISIQSPSVVKPCVESRSAPTVYTPEAEITQPQAETVFAHTAGAAVSANAEPVRPAAVPTPTNIASTQQKLTADHRVSDAILREALMSMIVSFDPPHLYFVLVAKSTFA